MSVFQRFNIVELWSLFPVYGIERSILTSGCSQIPEPVRLENFSRVRDLPGPALLLLQTISSLKHPGHDRQAGSEKNQNHGQANPYAYI